MFTDLPIQYPALDRLGRSFLASEIASGLVSSFSLQSESVVIGINGAWGSGKSTLINFIISEVETMSTASEKEIVVMRFNPWMFTGQRELQNIFFKELFIKLGSKKGLLKKASKKLAGIIDHFTFLKYAHAGAGEALKDFRGFLETVSKEKDLSELKAELDKILIESEVKLYITIDDIDRLTPPEITNIFQLVKLNGNFANTVFILAYDQDVVTQALSSQFGGNSKKYLEKIIQVDYTLPEISKAHIAQQLEESLEHVFSFDKELSQKISRTFNDFHSERFVQLLSTLRDVYRYTNALRLRLPSIYKEINLRDFFIVESLRIFAPDAYRFIIDNKHLLMQGQATGIREMQQLFGTPDKNAKDTIQAAGLGALTESLVKTLFDPDTVSNPFNNDSLLREQRAADRNYFDRYFNLQLSPMDIREKDIHLFISDPNVESRLMILRKVTKNQRLSLFLNWIEIRTKYERKVNFEDILKALLIYTRELKYTHPGKYLGSDLYITIGQCSKTLERIKGVKLRRQIIIGHFSSGEGKFTASDVFLCDSLIAAKRRHASDKLTDANLWYDLFTDNQTDNDTFEYRVETFRSKIVNRVFLAVIQVPAIVNGDELFLILAQTQVVHPALFRQELPSFLASDKNLANVLFVCITRYFVAINGVIGFKLSKEFLFDSMEPLQIRERIEKMNLVDLDEDQIAAVNFFKKVYDAGFPDKIYDLYTLEEIQVPGGILGTG